MAGQHKTSTNEKQEATQCCRRRRTNDRLTKRLQRSIRTYVRTYVRVCSQARLPSDGLVNNKVQVFVIDDVHSANSQRKQHQTTSQLGMHNSQQQQTAMRQLVILMILSLPTDYALPLVWEDCENANFKECSVIDGTLQNETIDLSTSNQCVVVFGNLGDDIINGSSFSDCISGGAGQDVISGGDGDDYIMGGIEADVLYGGAGNDVLWSSHNPFGTVDYMSGGPGNDTLIPGLGVNHMTGGRPGMCSAGSQYCNICHCHFIFDSLLVHCLLQETTRLFGIIIAATLSMMFQTHLMSLLILIQTMIFWTFLLCTFKWNSILTSMSMTQSWACFLSMVEP